MIASEIKKALSALYSMLVGLKVTGLNFCLPQVTVHYPRQVVKNISTFRGHIDLIASPKDPSQAKCILCGQCESNCPSGCIGIESQTIEVPAPAPSDPEAPPAKPKKVKQMLAFHLDYNLCSLCGLCVQNCPVDSLEFSQDVYIAGYSRSDFEYELLARLRKKSGGTKSGGGNNG